mmetsp:Transcript_64451/g.153830  ORF Transcript_64451/g.153830 Transcript_64451/m.153830 type:complete len:241 (-) Transcript_64451:631-1353(-)
MLICLSISLLLELDDEILDHLLHLVEWIRRHMSSNCSKILVAILQSMRLQKRSCLLSVAVLHSCTQLGQSGRLLPNSTLLQKLWQVLLGVACHIFTHQNLCGFLQCLQLVCPDLLILVVLLGRGIALCCGGGQGLLILSFRCCGHGPVFFGLCMVSKTGVLGLRLLCDSCLCVGLVVSELLKQHLVVVLRVHLSLLQSKELILKLELQFLEHVDDAAGLELISVCLWRGHLTGLLLQRKE